MYGVFVYWADAPKRAERLANGCTTRSKVHATMFPTRENAEKAAHQGLDGIDGVLSYEVRPF